MPRKCPGDDLGASPKDIRASPRPDSCVNPHRLDRMSAGQTGHFGGVGAKFPYVYWAFFFSFQTKLKLKGGKRPPHPQDFSALLRKRPFLLRANFVLTKDRIWPYYGLFFVVKFTGKGLVVKRPGVVSKDQMLNLVLGVGVFSLLPIKITPPATHRPPKGSTKTTFSVVLVLSFAFEPCFLA